MKEYLIRSFVNERELYGLAGLRVKATNLPTAMYRAAKLIKARMPKRVRVERFSITLTKI